ERDHLGGAQTRTISHAQRGLVFEPWRCIQEARDLLRAEHDRQLAGLGDERRVLDDIGSLERDPEEETQCSNGVIEYRYMRAVRRSMQLKAPYVLKARCVWRSAEEH